MELQEAQEGRLLWPRSPLHPVCGAKSLQPCPTLCNPLDCTKQTPLSMGFPRQEYWTGLPSPPPGDLPDPGIKPVSPTAPALQADSLPLSHQGGPLMSFSLVAEIYPKTRQTSVVFTFKKDVISMLKKKIMEKKSSFTKVA